jgi:hypothetical protein
MDVKLDRKDLESLVRGVSPYYSVFENPLVKRCGSWTGGFVDKWSWNKFDDLSDSQLMELYTICKESWK